MVQNRFNKIQIEQDILSWMPSKVMHSPDFNTELDVIPLMCHSLKDSPMHQSIMHGVGCILVFEYAYFLLQTNEETRNALHLAVKEYQSSGTQANVLNTLQHIIEEHGYDQDSLMHAIMEIILNHHMSKKFL
ncbi:hypothetical protein SCLCIDRAFT_1209207 [Scleroderma citrinum Foug A]|uniref:Uncharacterized protein n=1 Tax=Scleroderma citrinum Foug A TaxID=1036808 RepID=A0A0C3EJF8_9AGAM|nr:hypothetical protein SCLCIDRAFT_1209207 [Scleroderma citrinum Foug A]